MREGGLVRLGLLAASVIVFLGVSVAVPAAIFRTARSLHESVGDVPLDALTKIDRRLRRLSKVPPETRRIAYLGDSMLVSFGTHAAPPQKLQAALDQTVGDGHFRVQAVAAPGMGLFDFYFIADRVADARPDQVILSVNLTSFAKSWRETFPRPELAGVLPAARIPQALHLPLDWIGMTADRLLGYFALVQLGGLESWHWLSQEQARIGALRSEFVRGIGERFGDDADMRFAQLSLRYFNRKFTLPDRPRLTPRAIEDRYGPVLRGLPEDDPNLLMLDVTIRILRDAGIDVLVYTNPTNVEHIERVGSARREGMAQSIRAIEHVVTSAGARFVDLHDLVADDGFRDGAGHLNLRPAEGESDGAQLLAESLAPIVVEEAERSAAKQRSPAQGPD